MAVRILINEKSPRGREPGVTINQNLRRLTFNKAGLSLLREHHKKETDYLQILLDDDNPNVFWLRLSEAESTGAKKMDRPSASTRSVNISLLLNELKLNLKETKRFPLIWDAKIEAGKVTLDLDKEKEVNEK